MISKLPPSSEPWYDTELGERGLAVGQHPFEQPPEKRRSLARFILNGNGGEVSYELDQLADWDRQSLEPWASAVLGFDDEALDRLEKASSGDFWRAGVGASDEAIDDLAGRCSEDRRRLLLMIGTDSDRALAHLGELGRASSYTKQICERYNVAIPVQGAARRRYSRKKKILAAYDAEHSRGVRLLSTAQARCQPPADEVLVDPRGFYCDAPLSVEIDLDLSLVEGAPEGRGRWITTLCERCEGTEDLCHYRWRSAADGRLEFTQPREPSCPGEWAPSTQELRFALEDSRRYLPYDSERPSPSDTFELGGWPSWLQADFEAPLCCEQPMFFVGQACTHNMFATAYLFVCECGIVAQNRQFT